MNRTRLLLGVLIALALLAFRSEPRPFATVPSGLLLSSDETKGGSGGG
jgi:hypothetical protein